MVLVFRLSRSRLEPAPIRAEQSARVPVVGLALEAESCGPLIRFGTGRPDWLGCVETNAQPPRALPRRYWFQAATNSPTSVTGISPSTMPQRRGSIMEGKSVLAMHNSSTTTAGNARPTAAL